MSGCPAFESQGSSEVPSARPRPELAFEVEGRGTILTLADDFIYEFTASNRLHGDYGPHTRWTDRYMSMSKRSAESGSRVITRQDERLCVTDSLD